MAIHNTTIHSRALVVKCKKHSTNRSVAAVLYGGLGDAMKTEGSEEERPYRGPAVEDNVESLEEANDGDDGSAGTGVTR